MMWEHPRARGENRFRSLVPGTPCGTSPRTRGKPTIANSNMCSRRNIPAHAGKTIQAVYQHQESPEHPRARGENVCPHTLLPCLKGTSPRTRGKHNPRDHTGYRVRNIPAHAGKTRFFIVLLSTYSEHPRARGENLDARFDMAADLGTSPRTRGKRKRFT